MTTSVESSAGYELSHKSHGVYLFTTRYGVEYSIGVYDYSVWFGLPSAKYKNPMIHFHLGQINKDVRNRFDPLVKTTVTAFILYYLERDPDAIFFYVCSAADGKESRRKNTFDRWFSSSKEKPDFIIKTTRVIDDQEIHFLYRKDRSGAQLLNDIELYSLLPAPLVKS